MSKREAQDIEKVYEYLKIQNRPYSVQDIATNMHKDISKTLIQKVVDNLVIEKKVKEKVYNKQRVFCIDQNQLQEVPAEEMKQIDEMIIIKDVKISEISHNVHFLTKELSAFSTILTLEDAIAKLDFLNGKCEYLQSKINELRSICSNHKFDPNEHVIIEKLRGQRVGQWRKRKKLTCSIIEQILDGYPKSKRELIDEIGIETDEDSGAIIPIT